jgi:hypothetical protein
VPPVMLDKARPHFNELASGPSTLVEAHSFTGTGTEVMQPIPRVVPTVPPVILVDKHSDCLNLSSINGSVRGTDIPTKGVVCTLASP